MSITRSLRTAAVIAAFTGYAAMGLAVNTAKAADTGSLTVTFEGVKSTTGQIMVALYDSDAQYASGKPVRIVPNFMNREQLALSDRVYEEKRERQFNGDGPIVVGYFSGSPSHNLDFAIIESALVDLLEADERVLEDPAPGVWIESLAGQTVNLVVRGWTRSADGWATQTDLLRAIKRQVDAGQISIPSAPLDVHLTGDVMVPAPTRK